MLDAIIAFLCIATMVLFSASNTYQEDKLGTKINNSRDLTRRTLTLKSKIKEQIDHEITKREIRSDEQAKAEELERIELERQEAERAKMKVWALELEEKERQKRDKAEVKKSSGGGVLTKSKGVNYFNGRKETYYSSRVLYHYRTGEWTAGSDGVYRDSAGHVVVAASDLSQGSIVETSLGTGKVYDSGCAAGVTDIYVNW